MSHEQENFVLGLDLDGVVADFYGHMRQIAAQWRGVDVETLTEDVSYGLQEWDLRHGEYEHLHRFAVTQRDLFKKVSPLPGAASAIRKLSTEGVRIRVITHRLFIPYFHQTSVQQTVEWLDYHAVPYWDLCFMKDKSLVDADLYIEDAPQNVERLEKEGCDVLAFTNSTNIDYDFKRRVDGWSEAEKQIRKTYYTWRVERCLPMPPDHGQEPPKPREHPST
jgi:5'(3')-deoxyribonucleotidase